MTDTPGFVRGKRFPISLPMTDEIILQLLSSTRGQSKAATAEQILIERLREPDTIQVLVSELKLQAGLQGKIPEDLVAEFLKDKIPEDALGKLRGQSVDVLFGISRPESES